MADKQLNIDANRSSKRYSQTEMLGRILWMLATPFFRYSPRPFFTWRRWILSAFGAKIASNVNIYSSAKITIPWNLRVGEWSSIGECATIYNLGIVCIGANCTVSQNAHLCAGTHDYTVPTMPLVKSAITIEDQAWICADAFVAPGVTVHTGAIVGARGVVIHDVPPWTVVAGNPAKFIKQRTLE